MEFNPLPGLVSLRGRRLFCRAVSPGESGGWAATYIREAHATISDYWKCFSCLGFQLCCLSSIESRGREVSITWFSCFLVDSVFYWIQAAISTLWDTPYLRIFQQPANRPFYIRATARRVSEGSQRQFTHDHLLHVPGRIGLRRGHRRHRRRHRRGRHQLCRFPHNQHNLPRVQALGHLPNAVCRYGLAPTFFKFLAQSGARVRP